MSAPSHHTAILFHSVYTRQAAFWLAHEFIRQKLPVLLDTRSPHEVMPSSPPVSWPVQVGQFIVILSPSLLLDGKVSDTWLFQHLGPVLLSEKPVVSVLLYGASRDMLATLDAPINALLEQPVFMLNQPVDMSTEEILPVIDTLVSFEGEGRRETDPPALPPWLKLTDATEPTPPQLLAEADLNAAFVAFHQKDYPRAAELAGHANRRNPSLVEARKLHGDAYFQQGQYSTACDSYGRALALHPSDYRLHHNRGLAFYHLGQFEEAIANFSRGLELNPDFFRGYAMRALAKFKLGRLDESILDNNEMIRLRPDNAVTYNNRASTRYTIGDFRGALMDARRATELDPAYAYGWDTLGQIQFVLGNIEPALEAFIQAVTLCPEHTIFQATQALTRYARGDTEVALTHWQTLLADEPRLNDLTYLSEHLHWQQPLLDIATRLIQHSRDQDVSSSSDVD